MSRLLLLTVLLLTACKDGDDDGFKAGADCDDAKASVYPGAAELCNGIDDDCNGTVDDGFDFDGDGITRCGEDAEVGTADDDCDDLNPAVGPGAEELCNGIDDNCDGQIDEGFDSDEDGVTACGGDCDDAEAGAAQSFAELCDGIDNNCNGQVDEGHDLDGDGVTTCQGDCDDLNAAVADGSDEVCDGLDNDCDGQIDEGFDLDGDGVSTCEGDCDDDDPSTASAFAELCDGIDNDCDGAIDNGFDLDADGVTACDGDCDDFNGQRHAGLDEVCDGVDNNCDGEIDNGFDVDADGVTTCAGDCDDGDSTVGLAFDELCDAKDNDCDGEVDEGHDFDLDGVTRCGADGVAGTADDDCEDLEFLVHPGATELCDGRDNDCDGVVPSNEFDGDGDGFAACQGDCDDSDPAISPLAVELGCDGLDNDCDAATPDTGDSDGDGFDICDGDCDDGDPSIYPWATELCDDIDQDCDGLVDEDFDLDWDGWSSCGGDCDDDNALVAPDAAELCDGLDNDCNGMIDDGWGDADADGTADCMDTEGSSLDCNDGVDNDGDRWTDCDDPNCVGVGSCPNVEVCFNEADDDGDGLVDCDDSDCAGHPSCECTPQAAIDCGANTTYYGELWDTSVSTTNLDNYSCGYSYPGFEQGVSFTAPFFGRFSFEMRHPDSDVDLLVLGASCTADDCIGRAPSITAGGEAAAIILNAGETIHLVSEAVGPPTRFTLETTACEPPSSEVCDDFIDNDFDGDIDCADPDCSGDVACQVAFGQCLPSGTIACNQSYFGDSTGQNSSIDVYNGICSTNGWGEWGPEVAYQLNAPPFQTLIVDLTTFTSADLDVQILQATCDANTCLDQGDISASVYTGFGGTYYVVVDGYLGDAGPYQIDVSCY